MKVQVILCEDEPEAVEQFCTLIREYGDKHSINIELLCYSSGEELLGEWLVNKVNCDIIYLDILMGRINKMETARALCKAGCKAQIVF